MAEFKYKYCPMCATPLTEKYIFEANCKACPNCGFIHFLDPKVVTVVVVGHEGKVLLGKRNINPGKGMWSIPGGYVNQGEKWKMPPFAKLRKKATLIFGWTAYSGVYSDNGLPYVLAAYYARVVGDDVSALTTQPEEVAELGFFPFNDTPPLAFELKPKF